MAWESVIQAGTCSRIAAAEPRSAPLASSRLSVFTNASAIPFDCVLAAGMVVGSRVSRSAVQSVSKAV